MSNPYLENLFSLAGKTAVISGASSGLGAHFAAVLSAAGASVILMARREDKLVELAANIEKSGGEARTILVDVSEPGSVYQAFDEIDKAGIPIDILVNNAGISSTPTRFTELEEAQWGYLLDVNLKGAWRIAKQAAIRMKERGTGVIINTGSIYSQVTGLMKADYNVSKAALEQLSKNIALELGRYGVRVNTLCPGYFASDINSKEFSTDRGKAYIRQLVPQRLGRYEELDGPLLLLASGAGSFINGASLVVDGGTMLHPV